MDNKICLDANALQEAVKLGRITGDLKLAGNTPFVVIPKDAQVVSLREYLFNGDTERPAAKRGTVSVLDAASFIEYWTLFSDEHSRIFADETKSQVLAVLDYHGIGENAPRWGRHRVNLTLRFSEEWSLWTGHNGQKNKFSQLDFAEFIEDNTPDFVQPKAADMLEMARTLSVKTDVDFSSAVRNSNGQVQIKYNETVRGTAGTGNVEIPEEFIIQIPVYVGTPRVPVRARLRYRLASGKLTIWYDLLRPDAIQRDVFVSTLEAIRGSIQTPIINGSPAS